MARFIATMITRVGVSNYTSLANCSVELSPLTFLVGPNGAGKSNFIRVLSLVSNSLRSTLSEALYSGMAPLPFRFGRTASFQVRLDFTISAQVRGHYAFEVRQDERGLGVEREECVLTGENPVFFRIHAGVVTDSSITTAPVAALDRLYLVNASGLPEFRPVYNLLSGMLSYNPDLG